MIKRKEVVRSLVTFQDGDCDGDDGTTYSSYSGSDSGSTRPSSKNGEEGDRPPLMSMMTLARVRCGRSDSCQKSASPVPLLPSRHPALVFLSQ